MKTKLLIIVAIFVFFPSSFLINDADALCLYDVDWPDKPCYGCIGCYPGLEKDRVNWVEYREFKGQQWMEQKRIQMQQAIDSDTLNQWLQLDLFKKTQRVDQYITENSGNRNVWYYYYIFGEAPDEDGKYVFENQLPPLKQLRTLSVDRISCNYDLVLILKHDDSPACVTYDTGVQLIERGWGTCSDKLDYSRGHPCGPHSSGVISFDYESGSEPEPEGTTEDEMNLRDARQKLREIYSLNSSFGPFNIKDVIVGYGIADGVLVVDVLTEYYESDHLDLIKQKIRDIVGNKVSIEFSPSGAIVPTNIESVFPYVWNGFLHRNGIEFTPKEQSYGNYDIGFRDINRVCSPIVASNGTEFYISSIFIHEPFEITGTFIDKIMPDDCYKIWKTDTILVEPDRILMLWLENYHSSD